VRFDAVTEPRAQVRGGWGASRRRRRRRRRALSTPTAASRARASPPPAAPPHPAPAQSAGYLRLAQLLRNEVLLKELPMCRAVEARAASGRRTEALERDDCEAQSRHILGLIGDAPVSYARWRVMTAADVDGVAPTSPAAPPVVVIDRLVTLQAYRRRGFAKLTLTDTLMDILQMMMQAGVAVQRIAMFIPRVAACAHAAETAMKAGLTNTNTRPADPTRTVLPAYHGDAGVAEFAVAAAALLEAARAAAQPPPA